MNQLFLFAVFFRIGLFSIGGGLATLPFLFELTYTYGSWLTKELIGDMLAVAQSLPGAIGANLSAYAGFQYAGIPGAYAAVAGLVAPSIAIITVIARMLQSFKESSVVKSVFSGMRPAAAGLLSAAGFSAISLSLWNSAPVNQVWFEYLRWKETLVFIAIFFLIIKFKKHPIVYIAIAGIIGIVLKL